MAELKNSCESPEAHPNFYKKLHQLLLLQKQGTHTQLPLQQLLLCSIFPVQIQALLKFELPMECLPHPQNLLDIGFIVRRLLLKWHSSNVLYRLYQYSMPFIKHNRLNFPSLRLLDVTILKHMVLSIFLTCLGSHRLDNKTPIWQVTRQLFVFFNMLMTQGSAADMYMFCEKHVYLLRLALIEHFVTFTNNNMQTEVFLMPFFVDSTYQHSRVSKQLQYVTDTFRQTTMQEENISWSFIESKAQQAIERCNRTCKAMPNLKNTTNMSHVDVWEPDIVHTALRVPRIQSCDIMAQHPHSDVLALAQIYKFHTKIHKHQLPLQVQRRQHEAILTMTETDIGACTLLRTHLFVCMQCNAVYPKGKKDMRYHFQHQAICTHCLQKTYVLQIQTLGHLIQVNNNYYYFCEFCCSVHLWQSQGNEFCRCSVNDTPAATHKHCVICYRTMHLSTVSMLDCKLGVMQTFLLCSKHMPSQAKLPYAYDLNSLRRLIAFDT